MKIVVLGSEGMLGHQMVKTLIGAGHHLRYGGRKFDVFSCIAGWTPDVVVNCAGIVKQRTDVDTEEFIRTNALLPHQLYKAARNVGARLIHFSTDCVFSGDDGAYTYTEDSRPDPVDLYGRSKLLGEVQEEGCLTIRTSIIGRELNRKLGLVEWLLSQGGPTVPGYTYSYFSGLTTIELSRLTLKLIQEWPLLQGLWHVAGPAISKFDLLEKLVIAYHLPTRVVPDGKVRLNRVLQATQFNSRVGYSPPSWNEMVLELAKEQPL